MKKEVIVDKYTGKKSTIYVDITDEDKKMLRERGEKKALANMRAKKTIKEYLAKINAR